MSRTTLCVLTAAGLMVVSLGVMVARRQVLGREASAPAGPGTYKVTLVARGKSGGEARLITACPLDFRRQHISHEQPDSAELTPRPAQAPTGERRQLLWTQRAGSGRGAFQARYQFYCRVDVGQPSSPMERLGDHLYARPPGGEYIEAGPRIDPNHADICNLALDLTAGLGRPLDQARALFRFVDGEIVREPGAGGGQSAVECLHSGRGDAAAQSRLLVALCRSRGIPARLVTGLTLARRGEQKAHTWVEAWVGDYWMPMCPFHRHCGRVPASYLIFGFGDLALVRGQNVRSLDYACLVEPRPLPGQAEGPPPSVWRSLFQSTSIAALPPSERGLAEFLLLLPLAALVICLFRNVIGVSSFGTFAPALIGLAFRDLQSLPGLVVFVSIVLIGWGMRRVLDRYHLLQVPRTAALLTLVVVLLLGVILLANWYNLTVTRYFSLFPMVILVGMIERFWTLESEDGTSSSFRALLGTMVIAASISLLVSLHAVVTHLCRYPETLGLVMAGQLLVGRYTGYRLSELFRFRDFVKPPPPPAVESTTTHEKVTVADVVPLEAVAR